MAQSTLVCSTQRILWMLATFTPLCPLRNPLISTTNAEVYISLSGVHRGLGGLAVTTAEPAPAPLTAATVPAPSTPEPPEPAPSPSTVDTELSMPASVPLASLTLQEPPYPAPAT